MPKKIILDCDPGHDDAVAIMLAAASKEIEILGITCVGGNVGLENTVNNALKVCILIEKIPVNYHLFQICRSGFDQVLKISVKLT